MYELMVEDNFSAAHQLRNYEGECEKLHGHTWKVQVFLRGSKTNQTGLVLDFRKIKEAMQPLLQTLDHTYLNELPMFTEQNPSSENIARWLYEELLMAHAIAGATLWKVVVWESDTACAAYWREV